MDVAIALVAIYLPDAMRDAVIESTTGTSIEIAEQFKLFRNYSMRRSNSQSGISGESPSKSKPPASPGILRTFHSGEAHLTHNRLSADTVVATITPYDNKRTMDDFQTKAWEAFRQTRNDVFAKIEIGVPRTLRVAVPDRITDSGEVEDFIEVTKIVEPYLAAAEQRSHIVVGSLAVGSCVVSLALAAFTSLVNRRTRERQEADKRAHFLAAYDPLTGSLNRRSLQQVLAGALKDCSPAKKLGVHYIDVDKFKSVNDTLGHGIGDKLLQTIADRIRRELKDNELLARIGGDEFVMLQMRLQTDSDALERAKAVCQSLNKVYDIDHNRIQVSASIGVMISSGQCENADGLLKAADVALYQAKAAGRNRVVLFRPEMHDELRGTQELECLIRDKLQSKGFDLHFQQIVSASDIRLVGFEALLRLTRLDGSDIAPAEFIPVAEQMGLIGELGAWAIRAACQAAAAWPQNLTLAVNLSPAQFDARYGKISDTVRAALQESGLPANRLELEITEGLLLKIDKRTLAELRELNELGVSLALDDFGSGYSSLNYLGKLPIQTLKIDRSFILALGNEDSRSARVVKAIVYLARMLNMRVTAEGVETSEQAELLTKFGCDQLQGYFFARPVAGVDLARSVLKDWGSRSNSIMPASSLPFDDAVRRQHSSPA